MGKGKGSEGRGGGGWEGAAAARVRAGAAAVAAPLTPACLGALCLCPTVLCAGGRAGEGEGKWAGQNELGGGAPAGLGGVAKTLLMRKRRRGRSWSLGLELWVVRSLYTPVDFDTVCVRLCMCTRADLHSYAVEVLPSLAFLYPLLSQLPTYTDSSISEHGSRLLHSPPLN